jgi:hypothetical protein
VTLAAISVLMTRGYEVILSVRPLTCLRRLVAGLSPLRYGFDTRSVHVGFVVEKNATGTGFSPSTSVLPCQLNSTGAPLLGKMKKLIIFITGLHIKPPGCGASVASTAGPFTTKKNSVR